MWSYTANLSFDELIETLTPKQFKIFIRFMYEMLIDNSSNYEILYYRVNSIYIDALEKHNTDMIEIFEDDEFTYSYWWAFRDYINHHYDTPNLHCIMSCVKYHLKNKTKNLLYYLSNIIDSIEEDNLVDMNLDYVVKYFLMFGCNMNTIVYEHIKIDNYFI